jgi:hypothetical protein
MGIRKVFLSIADISSLRHRIAPAPLGMDPLSNTLNADEFKPDPSQINANDANKQ